MLLMKKNFFDQPIKNGQRTYDNIQKNESGQGDDYTTGCLLDYPHSKEHYKVILEVWVNHKNLMLIQKQTDKYISLEI